MVLRALRIRNPQKEQKGIDTFFTAVSAATLSSMSTVEMEVFSNSQLIVLTILMLLGGEVFTSLLGLQFKRLASKYSNVVKQNQVKSVHSEEIELEPSTVTITVDSDGIDIPERSVDMKYTTLLYLSYVVIGYLIVIHIVGATAIITYMYLVSDARKVLKVKGLSILTFSIFTAVSSFTNCGFVPTNENMIVFKKNLGLLVIIVPQCLLGGTMYSPALRTVLWFLKRMTKRNEFENILREEAQMGYDHLFSRLHSLMLVLTVLGFLVVQVMAMFAMEWRNEVTEGLTVYQKVVNYLFLSVNSRHTGESTVDLSKITPAILVLFVFMM
jgi:Trk-type K+ transport system membrane component